MARQNPFLSEDGFINLPEMIALCRDIEKEATALGLKPAEIYFAPKVIPKYDETRAENQGEAYTKKRAVPIKSRTRMPASGTRVKMQVLLRNFKKLEELGTDFVRDYELARKAIDVHTAKAEKLVEKFKAAGAKAREKAGKEFDKNIDCFLNEILPEGFKEGKDYVVGTSMMGKTLLIRLPNGGYVSVGKADAARFEKAANPVESPIAKKAPAGRGRPKTKK